MGVKRFCQGRKQYDKFLKRVYGDYMKLPPKEKQVLPHEYDAFWRE